MALDTQNWGGIHPSVYRHAFEPVSMVPAELRSSGAVRYSCPRTGSFVLVTEPSTIVRLTGGKTRLRCADCGEMHLLSQIL